MTSETWTTITLLNWTKEYFEKKGIAEARLEAELLLAHVLGWKRIELYSRFEEPVGAEKLKAFREAVKRRGRREPAQYIMGVTEFCGLGFKSDRRALIPRPETELLIDVTMALAEAYDEPLIVDIGTGSGILGITAAKRLPKARVLACDISSEAIELARENAAQLGVSERVEFRCGDFAETLAEFAGRVDIALANPPYVSEGELPQLEPELREHEPRVALVAGPEGTEVQARLVAFAATLLKIGGNLVMEMGVGQAGRIREMVARTAALELVRFEKDFSSIERVAVIRKRE
jgi:release factor glutamine methyltransferase